MLDPFYRWVGSLEKIVLGGIAVGEEGLAQLSQGVGLPVAVGIGAVGHGLTDPGTSRIDRNTDHTAELCRQEGLYRRINAMLTTNDFGDIDLVLSMRDRLFETISDAIKSELRRFNTSGKGSTKASMLYLTILNETRTMVLQLRNLLKAQRHFLETKGVIKSWLYYAK